ncbi:MAG TPA: hypothetical protein VEA80_14885 [Vitreimonas sp.]|uniref:hypothetical protein n=1 Tax=Vitreimonas sp. TaxID=3069702 RepID=UPI002D4E4117|nr:hypothetical protein [Vitreimonas sp.]HYD88758.1 hypothetical protein [Vitreimonas sp.]
MAQKPNDWVLSSPKFATFLNFLEEVERSRQAGAEYFIEPASGVLGRAKSKRNQIIFGRRGSGKSSLLEKTRRDLGQERIAIGFFIDCEPHKDNTYPNVLILILIDLLSQIEQWLSTASSSRPSWSRQERDSDRPRERLSKKIIRQLLSDVAAEQSRLEQLLVEPDEVDVERMRQQGWSNSVHAKTSGKLASHGAEAAAEIGGESNAHSANETKETFRMGKRELLSRQLKVYRGLIERLTGAVARPIYILLDDLYHVHRSDQPHLVGFLHSLVKGKNACIKIGTVRSRSSWYLPGTQPVGMKIGDDASEIDLDVTLEDYDAARLFLHSVASKLAQSRGFELSRIITNEAFDRLLLGSGGVARDMINIWRKASAQAVSRIQGRAPVRMDSVTVEDVSKTIADLDELKQEDLGRDVDPNSSDGLLTEFARVKDFCFSPTCATNVLLIEREFRGRRRDHLNQLVDLKFLHIVKKSVSVPSRAARVYDAFMLDMSQYTGPRQRKNFRIVNFTDRDLNVQLGQPQLIYCEGDHGLN